MPINNINLTQMDTKFSESYNKITDALQSAHDSIAEIDDSAVSHLKQRIISNIKRDINQLKALSKQEDMVVKDAARTRPRPLGTMFGYDVKPKTKDPKTVSRIGRFPKTTITKKEFTEVAQQTTQSQEGEKLNIDANNLYGKFLDIKTDNIRDGFGDREILAVAKLAGLPVTTKTEVDVKFIDQIKDAIRKQKELEAKKQELDAKTPKQLDEK